MPRIEVLVRVMLDTGEETSGARFTIQNNLVNEIQGGFNPEGLVRYLGERLRQSVIHCPIVALALPEVPAGEVTEMDSWAIEHPTQRELQEAVQHRLTEEHVLPDIGTLIFRPSALERLESYAQAIGRNSSDLTAEDLQRESLTRDFSLDDTPAFPIEHQGQFSSDGGHVITEEEFAAHLRSSRSARLGVQREQDEARVREWASRLRNNDQEMTEVAQRVAAEARFPSPSREVSLPAYDTPSEEVQGLIDLHREYPISLIQPPGQERMERLRQAYAGFGASAGIEPTPGRFTRRTPRNTQAEGRVARPSRGPSTPKEPEDRSAIPTRYNRKPVI